MARRRITECPDTWKSAAIGPWRIRYDPRLPLSVIQEGDVVVAVLGEVFAATRAKDFLIQITPMLEESTAQALINRTAGRYLLIRYSPQLGLRIQQDAAGLRTAYYTDAQWPFVIGSHINLVADAVGAQPGYFGSRDYLTANNMRTYPGRMTGRVGVVRLIPNCELHADSRVISRLYPRTDLMPRTVPEVASLIIDSSREQLAAIARAGRPVMASLSAGMDSRVTLALLRGVQGVRFFTYDIQYVPQNKASMYDRNAAVELASRFGLEHQIIEVASSGVDPNLARILNRNSPLSHSRPLALEYASQLPPDRLHIRSNVYEIGRAYYRDAGNDPVQVGARELQAVISYRKSTDRVTQDAWQEYMNATRFDAAVALGYDPLDLLYWEHRMGAWFSTVLHESDLSHDTHVLVNTREVLDATLGVPLTDRISGAVFVEVIKQAWPELLQVPINGELLA